MRIKGTKVECKYTSDKWNAKKTDGIKGTKVECKFFFSDKERFIDE